MHHETVKLDVFLLPSTGAYIYLVEIIKPDEASLARAN